MAEYIEREAVLKTLDILFERANDRYYKAMPHAVLLDVKGLIKTMDAADVAPVVHGEWIEDGYYGNPFVCSHCGAEGCYCGDYKNKRYYPTNFCSRCGADMRERKGDD